MSFGRPLIFIYIAWCIPLMALFWAIAARTRKRAMAKFIDEPLWPDTAYSLNIRRRRLKYVLISMAVMFSLIALTQPRWGFKWEDLSQKGLDILIAVDTSKSMLAEDIKPNRLERAKLAIEDEVSRFRGDRIGLIAFAGDAAIQCPLTSDYEGFLSVLKELSVDTVPMGGTSLYSAIETSMRCFEPGEKKYRVMVLISDGEELVGNAVEAAKDAKKEHVRIYCIGIGSERGSRIPAKDEQGYRTFLKDERGIPLKSRLNEGLLKKIAFAANGAYVRSTGTYFGLRRLYADKISKLEKRQIKTKKQKRYFERFQIPLLFSVILLILDMAISERRVSR